MAGRDAVRAPGALFGSPGIQVRVRHKMLAKELGQLRDILDSVRPHTGMGCANYDSAFASQSLAEDALLAVEFLPALHVARVRLEIRSIM